MFILIDKEELMIKSNLYYIDIDINDFHNVEKFFKPMINNIKYKIVDKEKEEECYKILGIERIFYYKFTEHNYNEGETWNFFFRIEKEQIEYMYKVKEYLKNLDQYDIDDEEYLEKDVIILCNYATGDYMATDQLLNFINFKSIYHDLNLETNKDYDILYKGIVPQQTFIHEFGIFDPESV